MLRFPRRPSVLLLVLLLLAPAAAAGGPTVEWATPEPGAYELEPNGTFDIEVECTDDPEGDAVFVVYFDGEEAVDEERDYWGTSPSYRWQVGGPGEYVVAAVCYDEYAETADADGAEWRLVVPQPPEPEPAPEPESPPADEAQPEAESPPPQDASCPDLNLDLPPPAAKSGEGRRAQDVLLAAPVLLERPDLLCAADEALAVADVGLALTTPFVEVQTTLESLSIGDYSAWGFLTDAVPSIGTASTMVQVAHEALLLLYELSALGMDMNQAVEAVHAFLRAGTDEALVQMKATFEVSLPTHLQAIASIEAASHAVYALADPVRDLLADVPDLYAEIDTWWIGKSLARAAVAAWEEVLQFIIESAEAAAAAVYALADPLRERVAVMEAVLYPPEEDAPFLPLTLLLAALALAARARVRQH